MKSQHYVYVDIMLVNFCLRKYVHVKYVDTTWIPPVLIGNLQRNWWKTH